MTEDLFHGQVAIITGAGRGMGREHAILLARLGASVVVNDIDETAAEVVTEITGAGGVAVPCPADVADEAQARSIVQTAIREFGHLDAVVCNAGIINSIDFVDMSRADFDEVMTPNFYGQLNTMMAAWPVLMEQRYGRVVLVCSSAAWVSQPGLTHYAAAKGAVLGMGKSLAIEAEGKGITVNMLAPGAYTRMSAEMYGEEAAAYGKKTMNPALVAPVVAWLLRRENALNGQIIECAAGRAALNFVGSTRGYWNEHLSVDQLVEHADQVLDATDFGVLADTEKLAMWMSVENTDWERVFAEEASS